MIISSRQKGFILAESIMTLLILSLAVVTISLAQQGLKQQQTRRAVYLTAARLAKEASDQLVITGSPQMRHQQAFTVYSSPRQVQVNWHGQKILRVLR